jgi:hypothetical protein
MKKTEAKKSRATVPLNTHKFEVRVFLELSFGLETKSVPYQQLMLMKVPKEFFCRLFACKS